MIQNGILHIIEKKQPKQETLHALKDFFVMHDVAYFCDFDDTITQNTCLLYSKFNYLTKKKHLSEAQAFDLLHHQFALNTRFVAIVKKLHIKEIVIVSSNNLGFLTKLIQEKKAIFDRLWLSFVGIVAKTPGFDIWPKDKRTIFPDNALYVADIFERKNFLWYDWFVCVDSYSFFNYYYIFFKKILFYLLFLIKHA